MKEDHQSQHTGPYGYGGGHKDSVEIALTTFRSKDQVIEGLNKKKYYYWSIIKREERKAKGNKQRNVLFLVCLSQPHITNQRFVNCANLEIQATTPALPCVHQVDPLLACCPRLSLHNLHSHATRSCLRCYPGEAVPVYLVFS
jgi:hypothetical protein